MGTVAKVEGRTSARVLASEGARRWVSLASLLFVVPALVHVVAVCRLIVRRLGHPVDFDWMESGMLYESARLLEGLPLYAAPGGPYVPFPYPIGYPAFVAALGAVFGVGYPLGRAVSFAWTVAASVVLARQVYQHHRGTEGEGGSQRQGAIAAALALGSIAAGYGVVDGWYDLVRVDAMAMGLLVCGAACSLRAGEQSLRARERRVALVGTAALCCLALLTKQSMLPGVLWVLACALLRSRREGAMLAALTAVLTGSALGALQVATQGNYWFYTVTLLSEHAVSVGRIREAHRILLDFAPYGPLVPIFGGLLALQRRPVALVAAQASNERQVHTSGLSEPHGPPTCLGTERRRAPSGQLNSAVQRRLSPRSLLWGGLFVGAWAFGLVSFAKVGGYHNNLLPAVWLAGPAFLILGGDLLAAIGRRRDWVLRWGGLSCLALLLATRPIPSKRHRVTDEQAERAHALRDYVNSLTGTVLTPVAPHLAYELGKGVHQLHLEALYDFGWAGRSAGDPLGAHLRAFTPDYVLLDGREPGADAVLRQYALVDVVGSEQLAWTTTGWPMALRFLFAPRQAQSRERVVFDFEGESLEGWTFDGDSFVGRAAHEPGCGQSAFRNGEGSGVLTSYHPRLGDRTRGVAVSPPFVVDRPALSLLVAGGWIEATRVELRVGGKAVRRISGMGRAELHEVQWDVADLDGSEARIAIVDGAEGPWGHVTLDHVMLYEPSRGSTQKERAPRSEEARESGEHGRAAG